MSVFLGFDVGGTSVRSVALSNESGTDNFSDHRQILRPQSNEGLIDVIEAIANEHQPEAIGVGCAGFVTHDGVVVQSPNIDSLRNYPLRQVLEEKLGCSVIVENDAAAAAWAEAKAGAGKGISNMAFVGFGTGIGGALVIDGKLVRGVHGFGSEPGHLTVMPDGLECPCGRKGCWELYASGSALGRYAREAAEKGEAPELIALAGETEITGEHVAILLAESHPDTPASSNSESHPPESNIAHTLLSQLSDWIAIGLNTLIVLTDPELVVLGGGLSEMGQPFLNSVKAAHTRHYTTQDTRPNLSLTLAHHTETAGSIGASLLAKTNFPEKSE